MKKHIQLLCLLICPLIASPLWASAAQSWIAEQIYRNECAAKPENLVHWNRGEEFPSLGIGHFIWYPAGTSGPFEESFPGLLRFMQAQGRTLPEVLQQPEQGAPWHSREQFEALKQFKHPDILAIQHFLEHTRELQYAFIQQRFERQLPQILDAASTPGERTELEQKVSALTATETGYYPLIDYLNFKGSGTKPSERYQGQGWGLLQVLQRMPLQSSQPITDFAQAARDTLEQRVALSPPERNEQRWLPGWHARIDTYIKNNER